MEENSNLDELIRLLDDNDDADDHRDGEKHSDGQDNEDFQVAVPPGSQNPLLDELVRLLDEDNDAEDHGGQEPWPDALGAVDVVHAEHPGDDQSAHRAEVAVPGAPQSPHSHARPLLVRRYMSSSSAKRRVTKNDHCNFCHLHFDKTNLEEHLLSSDSCKMLYLRRAHLKTVPAVMVTSFGCLYCDGPFNKLQVHLRKTPDCRQQYFARFGVDSVE